MKSRYRDYMSYIMASRIFLVLLIACSGGNALAATQVDSASSESSFFTCVRDDATKNNCGCLEQKTKDGHTLLWYADGEQTGLWTGTGAQLAILHA